ncbi:Na+/H+ antiporter [Nakamurella sp. PAMC28650]|uniref:Na+/H+ antiporter n=1 Tax=Nakamurella sp. PAMC28650 TaxID=2762325 RepID=UPI00164D67D2|nr:Na+/H+ antiporter [Nakamurella sp. PAMC28650]QNK81876.1 Na+/H+ antiporter [Nakamurella sp. PAMC28650]
MVLLLPVVGLVLGVLLVNSAAVRIHVPPPIMLVAVAFAVSWIPGVPAFELKPEFVLAVLIPPLLFGAAFESSAVAIRRLVRPIFQLSVVLVLLTAFSVALVLRWVLPGIPFAAALALGAIVAPPDAVAAVALGRRVGLPRRLVSVLEGESLFNDATSLVTLKVSIAAIGATSVAWAPSLGEFAWASIGGLLIGTALGLALSFVRRRAVSPLSVTALSLMSPFAAYIAGEAAHASGVLVVVVTGLVLGYRSPREVPASVRLTENATWAALRFVLEGAVFALIGLQLRNIFASLDTAGHHVILAVVAVLLTVIVSRPVWLAVIHALVRLTPRTTEKVDTPGMVVLSWAGMRGVVSLAAAQTLPAQTPYRSLLLVSTIAVIIGTLMLQGLSLPWVVRRAGVAQNHREDDLRERAQAHAQAGEAINARVDELVDGGRVSDRQAELMRKWASLRDWRNWDDDDESRAFGRRLSVLSDWRRALLGIERSVVVGLRDDGTLSEDVLQEMQHDLDLEEALLERRSEAVDGHLEELPPPGAQEPRVAAGGPPIDHDAEVDDGDVSALLLDEQRADGSSIGHRAARGE